MPRDPAHRRRHRWVRWVLVAVGAVVLFCFLMVGLTAAAMTGVRSDLEDGRQALQRGRRAVTSGDLEGAADLFSQASASFADAEDGAHQGLAGIAGYLPILGRNLDVASSLARAGQELAAAGKELLATVDALPDGIGSLSPQGGELPLDAIASLQGGVDGAAAHADVALDLVESSPTSWLFDPVADARFAAVRQTSSAADALHATGALVRGLPSFAGADGPRSYFFVAESPAELRGTGGLWGAWSIVTFDQGRTTFAPFLPIQNLKDFEKWQVESPSPDYERNYGQFNGAGVWRNMNMTPDFPSAAQAAINAYQLRRGRELDGVISADPFALRELLEVTGPVSVPGLDVTIDAHNVVPYTTNGAYINFQGEGSTRKAILGEVAGLAFQRFLTMDEHKIGRLHAIADAVAGGHLKIYSTDPALEDALGLIHADGALAAPPGDFLSVVVNSRSGSKVDFYATRSVDYDVRLGGDREAFATTTVTTQNDAPTDLPGHVVDPLAEGDPGDNISITTISCRAPCAFESGSRNGKTVDFRVGSELGFPWFQDVSTIPAGGTRRLELTTHLQDAWTGNSASGSYRLTFLNQTTVKPTTVRIAIHAPSGTRITWSSEPMHIDGGTAVWQGVPGARLELEVRFAAPLPLRLWRALLHPSAG